MSKKVVIVGSTGMVGGEALNECLRRNDIQEVITISRRPSGVRHDKLNEIILGDFLDYSNVSEVIKDVDLCVYCLAVYGNQVSTQEYTKITVEYLRAFSKALFAQSPDSVFCLFSAAGADSSEQSRTQFARDKGAAENIILNQGFRRAHAFRPGYIFPVKKRKAPNFGYRIARILYPVIWLLGKSASIKSTELAQVMIEIGLGAGTIDKKIYENIDMRNELK